MPHGSIDESLPIDGDGVPTTGEGGGTPTPPTTGMKVTTFSLDGSVETLSGVVSDFPARGMVEVSYVAMNDFNGRPGLRKVILPVSQIVETQTAMDALVTALTAPPPGP